MSDTDQDRTDAYARMLADELEALEELSSFDLEDIPGDPLEDLEEEDREELEEIREELSPDARELLEELRTSGELEDYGGSPIPAYVERALELTLHETRHPGDERGELESVELLLAFGGPSARVFASVRGSSTLAVRVGWWGSSSERTAYAPSVAAYLLELGEL